MGRLRTALSVAADLASLMTTALFIVGVLAVGGAIRSGRLGPFAGSGVAVQSRFSRGALSEPARGRMPLLSGKEYYPLGAQVGLIEFGDFECLYCARFDQVVLPKLKQEFVATGQLAFVYRDFPLPIHKQAKQASRAAFCAHSRGKYWQMHTRLFARPGQFLPDQLLALAKELDLDLDEFATCLSSGSASQTEADQALGRLLGVSVTPTFFVGRVVDGDEVEIKWKLLGAQPIEAFREIIMRVGREKGPTNK
jgi:protein-disulfide isomerase